MAEGEDIVIRTNRDLGLVRQRDVQGRNQSLAVSDSILAEVCLIAHLTELRCWLR